MLLAVPLAPRDFTAAGIPGAPERRGSAACLAARAVHAACRGQRPVEDADVLVADPMFLASRTVGAQERPVLLAAAVSALLAPVMQLGPLPHCHHPEPGVRCDSPVPAAIRVTSRRSVPSAPTSSWTRLACRSLPFRAGSRRFHSAANSSRSPGGVRRSRTSRISSTSGAGRRS